MKVTFLIFETDWLPLVAVAIVPMPDVTRLRNPAFTKHRSGAAHQRSCPLSLAWLHGSFGAADL